MINTLEIQEVLDFYPELHYNENEHLLKGNLNINHTYKDEHIIADYYVEISISHDYPLTPPTVKSNNKYIFKQYGHMFSDTSLCLGAITEQILFLNSGNRLIQWIEEFVSPYFFALEYFKKYKKYIFGERSHGAKGILEFYSEIFNTTSIEATYNILQYIVLNNYRGHILCPCGSGEKLRTCHGEIIKRWKHSDTLELLKSDLTLINLERKVTKYA